MKIFIIFALLALVRVNAIDIEALLSGITQSFGLLENEVPDGARCLQGLAAVTVQEVTVIVQDLGGFGSADIGTQVLTIVSQILVGAQSQCEPFIQDLTAFFQNVVQLLNGLGISTGSIEPSGAIDFIESYLSPKPVVTIPAVLVNSTNATNGRR